MEMMGDLEEAEPLYEESLRIKQVSYFRYFFLWSRRKY